jgi:hypothetical protein
MRSVMPRARVYVVLNGYAGRRIRLEGRNLAVICGTHGPTNPDGKMTGRNPEKGALTGTRAAEERVEPTRLDTM